MSSSSEPITTLPAHRVDLQKANQKKIRKLEKNKLEIESLSEENREMKNALREKDVVHLENKVKRLQRRLTDCIKREEIARRAKH